MRLVTRLVRFVVCFTVVLVAAPAGAQEFGGRIGASSSPDQFYFGVHAESAPVIDRLHFRPNAEIGLGQGATVIALNFELVYRFPPRRPWRFYVGGGPALNIVDTDQDTESEGGFNIVLGTQRDRLFFEVKIGALKSPDFKIGVGYVFR